MTTTIYFSGSITGGRQDVSVYRALIATLESAGHRVIAGMVAAEDVSGAGEALGAAEIFARDIAWLDEADVVVAEVSRPSHGVGYEIAYARHARGIPVIALFRGIHTARCSAMIAGAPGLRLIEYDDPATVAPRLLESIQDLGRLPDRLP